MGSLSYFAYVIREREIFSAISVWVKPRRALSEAIHVDTKTSFTFCIAIVYTIHYVYV